MNDVTTHYSSVTHKTWRAHNSVYYDCHGISLAQILPLDVYYAWLTIAAAPIIAAQWGGLSCRTRLDSEVARDIILLQDFGIDKHYVPTAGNIETTIKQSIQKNGYLVCRVDSYYHEHFQEFYLKQHRTNGHKITVIDWDETHFYGIDNVGVKTLVLNFQKEYFIESVRSNLFHVYEKEDTFYYLTLGERFNEIKRRGGIKKQQQVAIDAYIRNRNKLADQLEQYYQNVQSDLEQKSSIRAYAQIHNSYTTALLIETSYTALCEAYDYDPQLWLEVSPVTEKLIEGLKMLTKSWRLFKMLCHSQETSQRDFEQQILKALRRTIDLEIETNAQIQQLSLKP